MLYIFSFLIYLIIGFLPARAANGLGDDLIIESINLSSEIIESKLNDGVLEVPDTNVGSYSRNENKMFLFGHSSTVFADLDKVNLREIIYYKEKPYKIISREVIPKSLIKMNKLLSREETDTIIIMTCAGEMLDNQDASHRLILTAIAE